MTEAEEGLLHTRHDVFASVSHCASALAAAHAGDRDASHLGLAKSHIDVAVELLKACQARLARMCEEAMRKEEC